MNGSCVSIARDEVREGIWSRTRKEELRLSAEDNSVWGHTAWTHHQTASSRSGLHAMVANFAGGRGPQASSKHWHLSHIHVESQAKLWGGHIMAHLSKRTCTQRSSSLIAAVLFLNWEATGQSGDVGWLQV